MWIRNEMRKNLRIERRDRLESIDGIELSVVQLRHNRLVQARDFWFLVLYGLLLLGENLLLRIPRHIKHSSWRLLQLGA